MCDTVVSNDASLKVYCPDKYKTQRMFDRVVYEDPFLIIYCLDKYITQKMCDEAVDDFLAAFKLIPDWFVTSKMIDNFLLHCMQMKIYSTLKKVLVMQYLIVVEWAFLEIIQKQC